MDDIKKTRQQLIEELAMLRARVAGLEQTDIERRRTEKTIVRLASFPEHNPNPVVELDLVGRITYFNPAARRLFHTLNAEASEQQTAGQSHPWLAGWESVADRFQREKAGSLLREVAIGTSYYQQMIYKGDDFVRIYGYDVTEHKQVEEALRKSEELLKRSQDLAHLGSWVLDLADNRLTWSDEVYRIFDLEPQEFGATYETFLEAVHPDDRAAVNDAYADSLREGRDAYEIEHRIVRKTSGEIRYVHEKCDHVRDSSGKVIRSIGMVHDITEHKRVEETLRRTNLELQTRNEELDAFGHTVAHDLKNPLSCIISCAYLLTDEESSLPAETVRELLRNIEDLGVRMDNIIEELMLLAGLRKTAVKMGPLDMANIAAEAQRRLAYMIKKSRAEITSPPSWPQAVGYAPWVEEIWINYISNAIKYGGQPLCVELGAMQQGEHAHFWVRDNGPGLTREQQACLFQPFERLDQVRLEGHGLGLSIVQRIAERMDGQVGVESTGVPGEGATFSFVLPASRQ